MVAQLRSDFHTSLATIVLDDVQYRRSNLFYFLGKIESWGTSDTAPIDDGDTVLIDESAIIDSVEEGNKIRSNSIFYKKILPSDVSLVAKRYNWVSGLTTWEKWDHSIDMNGKRFYCLVSSGEEYDVYKCLDIPVELTVSGAIIKKPSVSQPSGRTFKPVRSSDGYLWKYMYSVPLFKYKRFTNELYFPVQRALSDSFYSNGEVEGAVVTNEGSGYTNEELTTISVSDSGHTTGSGCIATISSVSPTGVITGIGIVSGGSGYTAGARVGISATNGYGAKITPIQTGGVITSFSIDDGGVGYEIGQSVSVTVGGAKFAPTISSTGAITKLNIIDRGIGYITAPTLTVNYTLPVGATPPSGAYGANPTALLNAIVDNGEVVAINISDPGKNYPVSTATTIVVSGDGTGAEFIPTIFEGRLIDVYVDKPGINYTTIKLKVISSSINQPTSVATVDAVLSSSDFISRQSIVEQQAIPGAIYSVNVLNDVIDSTVGYSNSATLEITGDGGGAAGELVVSAGKIIAVNMTNAGSGYSYANLTVTDNNRLVGLPPVQFKVILPPLNGHGYDAVSELGGNTLAINSTVSSDKVVANTIQDYRQFGLMRNPVHKITRRLLRDNSQLVVYETIFGDVSGLLVDELLEMSVNSNTKIRYRVVAITGNKVILQNISLSEYEPAGILAAATDANRSYTVTSLISRPTLDKYSGKMLYIANENPFSFAEDRSIVVKTFISF